MYVCDSLVQHVQQLAEHLLAEQVAGGGPLAGDPGAQERALGSGHTGQQLPRSAGGDTDTQGYMFSSVVRAFDCKSRSCRFKSPLVLICLDKFTFTFSHLADALIQSDLQ